MQYDKNGIETKTELHNSKAIYIGRIVLTRNKTTTAKNKNGNVD